MWYFDFQLNTSYIGLKPKSKHKKKQFIFVSKYVFLFEFYLEK